MQAECGAAEAPAGPCATACALFARLVDELAPVEGPRVGRMRARLGRGSVAEVEAEAEDAYGEEEEEEEEAAEDEDGEEEEKEECGCVKRLAAAHSLVR